MKQYNISLEVKERKFWLPELFGDSSQFYLRFWFAFDYSDLLLMYVDNQQ